MRAIADRPRAVRWSELATREVASARDFYAGVCGRSYGGAPMDRGGVCTLARVGGRIVAGIIDMALVPEVADMDRVGAYLAVDDPDEAVQRARAGGGHVIREPWDIPGVGRIALVLDPSGAAVGS